MLIRLDKSKLFNTDPKVRFIKEYNVPELVFDDMWRRYKDLEYTLSELSEYTKMKYKLDLSVRSIHRWLWRTQVYNRAQIALVRGAIAVKSDYFNDLEDSVVKELTRGVRFSDTHDPKSLA